MSNKKLAILGIIAAVMLVWAVFQSKISNKSRTVSAGLAYLVSGVNTDDIGSIVIKSGDKTLNLQRQSGRFVVADKNNYPADTKKINELITDCLEIEVSSQVVTDNPANHEDLGVTEDKAKTIIKFLKPDSSELVGIIIGNTKENGQSSYVRLTSNDKVYVTSESPWIESDAINYVKTQITALMRKDTAMVTVNSPNGKYVLKPIADSEDVELVNLPAGKKLKQSEAVNIFTALSSLNFTNVMKNPGDLNFDRHYICKLYNSTEFTFDIASKDGATYVTCRALFTEGRPESIKKDEPEEKLKEVEEKLLLDDKADDFTKRHIGWVYEISPYKAKYLTMELSDLVEDEAEVEITENPDPNAILNKIQSDKQPGGL
ncbi:MAG: DUF4340 domain-containing protein [Sedimentisphaerales bacterium]|nr:DUF4340 domain-containing protein [Sedimentisphaerales bacterium]